MTRIRPFATGLTTGLIFASVIASSPLVNYPLNLQLPPVARVGDQYSFQFASTTFQPNPNQLQYSLVGNPSWLHINSSSRTLWGTPGPNDAGTSAFGITAAGEAGAVASMDSKLMVANDGPMVVGNVSQSLSKAGQLTGPSSLTLLPSKPFEVQFDKDMFDSKGKTMAYYATSADHTPLPAWISFNAQSLSFSGVTPLSPAPQSFNVLLIASDTPGFTEASVAFSLVVSNHQLMFKPLSETMNVTKGQKIKIGSLKEKLFLDNAPIADSDIRSANAESLPSWLAFDTHSLELNGEPPAGLMTQELSIVVSDRFGDTAKHTIHIDFTSKLFTAGVGQLNITLGQHFEYAIPRSVLVHEDEVVRLDMGELGEWLKFDEAGLSIQGTVPEDTNLHMTELVMTATTSDGAVEDSQTIPIQLSKQSEPNGSANQPPGASSPSSNDASHTRRKRIGIVIGSIVSALAAAFILLMLILCCCRRRKKQRKGYISPRSPRSPRKSDISRPMPPVMEESGRFEAAQDVDLEKGKDADEAPIKIQEPPRRLSLNLPSKRNGSRSPTTLLDENDDRTLEVANSSPHGFAQDEAGPSRCPHDSMRLPTDILLNKVDLSPRKRPNSTSQTVGHVDFPNSSPSASRRQRSNRGACHTISPSRSTDLISMHRRSPKSSSSATNTLSMVSSAPAAIPQQPRNRYTAQPTKPLEKQNSIRDNSMSDMRNSLEKRRNSWARKRASSRKSPFFETAAARVSSGNYSYKNPPAYYAGQGTSSRDPVLQQLSTNIVRPGGDVMLESESSLIVPTGSPKIRRPAETPSPQGKRSEFARSLRRDRSSLIRRHNDVVSSKNRDLNEEGEHTTQKIYEDTELSASEYSDGETILDVTTQDDFVPPLNIDKNKNGKEKEEKTKRKTELKRTSEREATPFHSLNFEHGGKENYSPSHDSNHKQSHSRSSPTRSVTFATPRSTNSATQSPTRPKTSAGWRSIQRSPPRIVRTPSYTSTKRRSRGRPLSQNIPSQERQYHPQSRQSLSSTHRNSANPGELSRSQSSSFPHLETRRKFAHNSTPNGAATPITRHRSRRSESSTLLEHYPHDRDFSGNLIEAATSSSPSTSVLRDSHIMLPIDSSPLTPSLPRKSSRRTTAAPTGASTNRQHQSRSATRPNLHHQASVSSSPFFLGSRHAGKKGLRSSASSAMSTPTLMASPSRATAATNVTASTSKANPFLLYPPHEPLPPTPTSPSSPSLYARQKKSRLQSRSRSRSRGPAIGLGVSFSPFSPSSKGGATGVETRAKSPLGIFGDDEGMSDGGGGGDGARVVQGKEKKPVSVEVGDGTEDRRGRSVIGSLKAAVVGREKEVVVGFDSAWERERGRERGRERESMGIWSRNDKALI